MSKRRATGKPIGGGGAGNPASIANLKRGGTVAPAGNQRGLRHGGYSEALVADVSDEVRELMAALGDVAPVRDPDGSLPAADVVAVERAARLLRRYRRVEGWLDLYGELNEATGDVKPAARLAGELGTSLDRALDALGMTPTSRARLGLDLARTYDLAQAMAADVEAERRERASRSRRVTPKPARHSVGYPGGLGSCRNGYASDIESAYGSLAAFDAALPTHNPVDYAAELAGIPIKVWYSTDDPVCVQSTVTAFASGSGAATVFPRRGGPHGGDPEWTGCRRLSPGYAA